MLIVDAFNILHARRSSQREAWGVADLLAALSRGRYAGEDITLVCDGSPGPASDDHAGVARLLGGAGRPRARRVLYANTPPYNREADDLIEELLAGAPDPTRVTIVSSDRRLRSAAARAGASSIAARDFVTHLAADLARRARASTTNDEPLDPSSVRWWLNYFESPSTQANPPSARPKRGTPPPYPPPTAPLATPPPLASLDPSALDMEHWLRLHPPLSEPAAQARETRKKPPDPNQPPGGTTAARNAR
jgi:hypothetical protein